MGKMISFRRLNTLFRMCLVPVASAVCLGQTPEQPERQPVAVGGAGTIPVAAAEFEIKPRLELHLPSVGKLITETQGSHAGVFVTRLGRMLMEMAVRPRRELRRRKPPPSPGRSPAGRIRPSTR